ncbi:MAG: efflux RND transporter periplasmic adaptor subunit [Thalassovita sp.]
MNLRPLLIVPPLALGVLGFLWMTQDQGGEAAPRPEAELAVRVEQVTPRDLTPEAVGYGRVEAVHNWSAISEVQGRIVTIADGLAEGRIVEENELLIAVDKTDYILTADKAEANILAAHARLAELDRQEKNTQASIAMEQRVLEVTQSEHARIKDLVARGTGTQSALDAQEKTLLKQEQAVANLENTMALYPSQRKSAEATLAVRQFEFAEAKRALAKSEIRAPLRGRVVAVSVEAGQFIRVGESLLTVEGSEAAEIVAEIQPTEFRKVVISTVADDGGIASLSDTSQVIDVLEKLGVRAEVRMNIPGVDAAWPAKITRMRGSLDSTTGTLGLVVEVAQPTTIGGPVQGRPPLTVGAFVSVIFTGPAQPETISVPRDALRYDDAGQSYVYIADTDNRLRTRLVSVGAVHGDRILVQTGLEPGDLVLLSDPRPPVPGLRLIPVMTDNSAAQEQ